jgi:hypothetical protein
MSAEESGGGEAGTNYRARVYCIFIDFRQSTIAGEGGHKIISLESVRALGVPLHIFKRTVFLCLEMHLRMAM